MPAAVQHVQSSRSKHITIAVPATGATALRIIDLALAGTPALEAVEVCQVIGGRLVASATTYSVGDTAASLPWTVTAGDEYEEPACDWLNSYIKSTGAGFNLALCVYLAGDPLPGATA